jgi:hypothetical protein
VSLAHFSPLLKAWLLTYMAALDDRYDVLDECQRLGLDYNRLDHQDVARASIRARVLGPPTAHPMKPIPSDRTVKLFKQRYGG